MYKVGDKVKVRDRESLITEYGIDDYGSIKVPLKMPTGMQHLCGKERIITHIETVNSSRYSQLISLGNGWTWCEHMFVPINNIKYNTRKIIKLIE